MPSQNPARKKFSNSPFFGTVGHHRNFFFQLPTLLFKIFVPLHIAIIWSLNYILNQERKLNFQEEYEQSEERATVKQDIPDSATV